MVRTMSLVAAGAYLRTLREAHELSRAKVATLAGTHESQIERIERGGGETRASLLLSFAQVVDADLNDLTSLLLGTDLTKDDGIQAAQQRLHAVVEDTRPLDEQALELLTEEQLNLMKEIIPTLTDEEFARLVEEIKAAVEEESSSDPSLIDALRAFVSGWRARRQRILS